MVLSRVVNSKTFDCPSRSSQNYPEDIREAVLAEVASLMTANENQPQFLTQLLRSLQLVSSDNQTENASQVPSNIDTQQVIIYLGFIYLP